MNTKVIIYDDSCPLCSAYTKTFVKTGFLEKEGRMKFSDIESSMLNNIDLKRCVNEIPVIDTATNQVWYGIDALQEVLQQKIKFIRPVMNIKSFRWILYRLYKLISYNRRVIVAPDTKPGNFDCTPDFNIKYRISFMLLFLILNTIMLLPLYHYVLIESLFKGIAIEKLQVAHFLLVSINITIAIALGVRKGIEYLGQINMLALLTILFFIPLILINKFMQSGSAAINNFFIGFVFFFILQEHIRRMKFIGFIKKHRGVIAVNIVSVFSFLVCLIK